MRIAVIGAGVTGLVAARRLGREGHACDVYERWPGLGGQAATIDVGSGHLLERYYHHLFTSDVHIVALCEELGMPDEIEWLPSSVAFFAQGALWPFGTPLDLLRFGPLPFHARIRMGLAVLALQRSNSDIAPYEAMTARSWITRRMGRAAWENVWGPLLRGKFGSRAEDISMGWLWKKLLLRREVKGKDFAGERLGYPRQSFERVFTALRDDIEARGGRVMIDRPVARLEPGWRVVPGAPGSFRAGTDPQAFVPDGDGESYGAVLATVPNDVFLDLAGRLVSAAYAERLRSIEYHTALCLLLELDRPFGRYYWTNIADLDLPFVGLVEHTNLVGPERYDGRRFLYVANYVEPGDPLLALSAEELIARYTPGLRKVTSTFDPGWIRQHWLHREAAAQPIVTVGYRERIPPLRTGVPGLVLANTTQVYPEDRGTNYAVRLGEDAACAVLAELG